jgi:acetyl-CoA carboxylase biotin carboxyl carrier protein
MMTAKIDYKEITKLIDLLEKRRVAEFELEIEGFKIRINRGVPQILPAGFPPGEAAAVPGETALLDATPPPAVEAAEGLHIVTSPMVGTFYRAPDPTSTPFVEIGDQIDGGRTLCIIEAMKLMNEIEADVSGTIEDIFVKNAQPVEYGQQLFSIRLA